MKNLSYLISAMTLLLASCHTEQAVPLHFVGKIGEKYTAEILLEKTGDELAGQFKYIDLNKEPINLRGNQEFETIRLEEFDNQGDVSGVFIGRLRGTAYKGLWKDPVSGISAPFNFKLTSDLTPLEKEVEELNPKQEEITKTIVTPKPEKKQEFEELNGEFLLKELFGFQEVENKNTAFSKARDNKTTFDTLLQYNQYGKEYALAYFSNYELGENDEPMDCHSCSGYVSIAKFFKQENTWLLEKFSKNCNCGEGSNGATNPPTRLVSFNDDYLFLQSKAHDIGQGITAGSLNLFNIKDFKQAVSIPTDGENSGAVFENQETYAFDSVLDFAICDDLPCITVAYSGSKPKADYSKIIYLNQQVTTYIYDTTKEEFVVAENN